MCKTDAILFWRTPLLRRRYEQAAVSLAAQHDWSRIALQFAAVLHNTVQAFRSSLTAQKAQP